MPEQNYPTYPLGPANGHTRSDGESQVSADELKRKKKIKLAIYISIFVVFQIIVITTMSLTVMKVKTPKFRLGNINVQSLESTPPFNFTTQIRIKNSANWGSYKFKAGNVTFQHQGQTVGVIDIAKGKVGWLSTIKRNANVSLNLSAVTELSSGVLTLNSVGRLEGKVAIMFIMKKKKATNMNCTIAFDVTAKRLQSLHCK